MTENCPQVTVFNFFVIKWSLSIHFFIELDLAKGMAHTKIPFLPCGVYSGWGIVVTLLVRMSVRPYVRPKFFLRFLFFWDPHVGSS